MSIGSEADPQPKQGQSFCFRWLRRQHSAHKFHILTPEPLSHPLLSPTPHPRCPQIPLARPFWGSGNPHGSPTAASPGWPSRRIRPRPGLSRPPCLLPHHIPLTLSAPGGFLVGSPSSLLWYHHGPTLTSGSWPRTGAQPCLPHPQTCFLDTSRSLPLLWLCPENVFWILPRSSQTCALRSPKNTPVTLPSHTDASCCPLSSSMSSDCGTMWRQTGPCADVRGHLSCHCHLDHTQHGSTQHGR